MIVLLVKRETKINQSPGHKNLPICYKLCGYFHAAFPQQTHPLQTGEELLTCPQIGRTYWALTCPLMGWISQALTSSLVYNTWNEIRIPSGAMKQQPARRNEGIQFRVEINDADSVYCYFSVHCLYDRKETKVPPHGAQWSFSLTGISYTSVCIRAWISNHYQT